MSDGIPMARAQLILLPPGGETTMARSRFGDVLRSADLDRDGYGDLVVGDPDHRDRRGGVWIHRGSPDGLGPRPERHWEGDLPGERLGWGIEVLDVDGDGWPDLVIASEGKDADGTPTSNLSVVRGGPGGWAKPSAPTWIGRADELWLAHLDLAVMDVDGDGRQDLVCAGLVPGPETYPVHCVFALSGGPSGLSGNPRWRVMEHGLGLQFGYARADAGDVDGDGFRDLLVSALSYPERESSVGRAFLFLGGREGVATRPSWIADYPLSVRPGVDGPGAQLFGFTMAGIGDANGDGIDDVAVAAPYADHDEVDEGAVFVYYGSRAGLSVRPDVVLEADKDFSVFGHSLAPAGDVDGDGRADLVVGVPTATMDQPMEGAVVLYRGRATRRWGRPVWARTSDRSHWCAGYRVVTGDFNGDGRRDVATTAHSEGKTSAVLVWSLTEKTLASPLAWAPGKTWTRWFEQRWRWSGVVGRSLAGLGALTAILVPVAAWAAHRRRVRRLREAADEAVLRERLRIVQDMHDEVGASLSRLRGGADGGQVADAAREVILGIERVFWTEHPDRQSTEDLACGLMDLAGNVLGDTSIRCRFDFPEELPDEPWPSGHLTAVYRAAQEALNNIRKHSGASSVRMELRDDGGELRLAITDDGVGLPDALVTEGPAPRRIGASGQGLRNMADRLRGVGGECVWEQVAPRGVRVTLRVPRAGASGSGSSIVGG